MKTSDYGVSSAPGSVFRHYLTLHYMNGMPEGLIATVRPFAGDTISYLQLLQMQTPVHSSQTWISLESGTIYGKWSFTVVHVTHTSSADGFTLYAINACYVNT